MGSMEMWMHAGSFLREKVIRLIQQVWKEGEMPEDWRMSIIVPLYKSGDQEKMENYRDISLLCTAYKVYAEIIRNRLEKEVERRSLLSENQAGFRKRRSTIDNIFVLSHMAQRKISEGGDGRKIYALFADLKAAFDNVDREMLWKIMRRNGLDEKMIRRVERCTR
ncbi:uncharacterized protein LOC120358560 [Solenopsis invicta]|uniref:uncharacterized protein LOC120358560 n=1 Tax=Solenopsis invicta TaxID=13686 RepID=UPI00193D4D6F|nr:uncharacterized protein LOC120358560 [Solenopsis invicta]